MSAWRKLAVYTLVAVAVSAITRTGMGMSFWQSIVVVVCVNWALMIGLKWDRS